MHSRHPDEHPLTIEGVKDLVAMTAYTSRPDLIVVPKVESPRDMELVAGR
ncbi:MULTISPECIES: hypothetical protein [unclassified Streptomyces]|nr:hypothetical protein [Streptomyces sp. NBC_00162]UUU37899.1 hypothetical protein JIW86_02820 [Streptomyces sp. NBC_00162]